MFGGTTLLLLFLPYYSEGPGSTVSDDMINDWRLVATPDERETLAPLPRLSWWRDLWTQRESKVV